MSAVFYPLCLKLKEKPCLVVGGGKVAERKTLSLLESGARVTVVSPRLTPLLSRLAGEGKVAYRNKEYSSEDLKGAFLVVAATGDPLVNQGVAKEAEEQGLLVSVVDNPEGGNFIFPAVVRREDLILSVSTGGKSPFLARRLRQELEARYGPEYGALLSLWGELRPKINAWFPDPGQRQEIFARLADSDLLELIRRGREEQVKERINQCISLWEV